MITASHRQKSILTLTCDADRDELTDVINSAVVTTCAEAFGAGLLAIVLTGSAARGEATFLWDADRWSVLGDAEFFLVFERPCHIPEPARIDSVRQQIEQDLKKSCIDCKLDLSPVDPNYLVELEPHILAYELKQCGRVVWGDRDILCLIPKFHCAEILLEDAWRLLSNRIVEFLDVVPELFANPRRLTRAALYRTVKLYLDMATSFLVFARRYEPTYAGRLARLRALATEPFLDDRAPFDIGAFTNQVQVCTSFKLQQHSTATAENVHPVDSTNFWQDAVGYAHQLWRWELSHLTVSTHEATDRQLIAKWARRESFQRRLRGWARVIRDSNWLEKIRESPRWLALAGGASPRHVVYLSAATMFFQLPKLVELHAADGLNECRPSWICSLSTVPSPSNAHSFDVFWRELAAVALSDYRRFIAVTRT